MYGLGADAREGAQEGAGAGKMAGNGQTIRYESHLAGKTNGCGQEIR